MAISPPSPLVQSSHVAASYKIIILGQSTVGKTSLMSKFTTGTFQHSLSATVGIDHRSKVINVDGFPIKLKIWDTAGQERFETITAQYLRGAEGIVLVFDLTRSDSVGKAQFWLDSINEELGEELPVVVVVGNKSDLMAKRCVDLDVKNNKVEMCSRQFYYYETSALTGENVEEMFTRVGQLVAYRNGLYNPQRRGATIAHNMGFDRTCSNTQACDEEGLSASQRGTSFRLSDKHKPAEEQDKSCNC